MTFAREFLREIQQRANSSGSYPMTNYSVNLLLTSKRLQETDKNVIYDAISNDVHRNKDPLSLRKLWNERIKYSNLNFNL